MKWLLIAALPLLAGCFDPAEYSTSGAFTPDRTQADMADFQATVAKYTDDVAIMESFPEQFIARGMTSQACDDLYEELKAKSYFTHLSACRHESTMQNPDQPATS